MFGNAMRQLPDQACQQQGMQGSAHLLFRALEAAEMRRAMPSSMLDVARGFCCARTSKAPRDMRTNSESRAHSAVVSWWPPVSAHTAPTASPLPTCMDKMTCYV